MDRVWIAPPFREECQTLGLRDTRAFSTFFGMQTIRGRKTVELRQGKIGPSAVFYKQYDYPPGSWRYFGRTSKARREFLSYEHLHRLGVPCATAVACGEHRDALGRLARAFIVTVAIPDALPLQQFLSSNPTARAAVFCDLARITRRAHDGGFIHRDLWVRNVLVNWQSPGRPGVWIIDSPKGAIRRVLKQSGKVLDLASLNKGAPDFTTRTERMRFLRDYLADNQNGQLKKLARQVLARDLRK